MGASLSAVAKSIYYADLYRLEIQRQLVKKKNKQTNSSRSICLHFPDLFIYLFIYLFILWSASAGGTNPHNQNSLVFQV